MANFGSASIVLSSAFKNGASFWSKEFSREQARDFLFVGMGTSFSVLGLYTWSGLSDKYLRTESVYARRYIGKYAKKPAAATSHGH